MRTKLTTSVAVALVAVAIVGSCTKKERPDFIITGNMEGFEGPVYLVAGQDTLTTATATAGQFTLSGALPEEAGVYNVAGGRLPMRVLLTRGDSVNFTGTLTRKANVEGMQKLYTMSGSRAVEGLTAMRDGSYAMSGAFRGATPQQRDSLMEAHKNFVIKTLEENLDNVLGMYLIANEQFNFVVTADQLDEYLARVPEKFKTTTIYSNAQKRIEALRAEEQNPSAANPMSDPRRVMRPAPAKRAGTEK